jgi:hypothetical protein
MSSRQAYRLGRTLTVVSAVIWLTNNFLHSFALSIALLVIGATALALVWKGSTK